MLDPVTVLNLIFDLVIVSLSAFVYRKKTDVLLLWIAVAFGCFAVSYVLSIFGIGSSMILIPLRTVGYLSVIVGLILHYKQRR